MLHSDWLSHYKAIWHCYSPLVAKGTSKKTIELLQFFKPKYYCKGSIVLFFFFQDFHQHWQGKGGRRSCAILVLREAACEVSRELHVATLLARIVGLLLRGDYTKYAIAFIKQYWAVAMSFISFNTVIKVCLLFSRVSESPGTIEGETSGQSECAFYLSCCIICYECWLVPRIHLNVSLLIFLSLCQGRQEFHGINGTRVNMDHSQRSVICAVHISGIRKTGLNNHVEFELVLRGKHAIINQFSLSL